MGTGRYAEGRDRSNHRKGFWRLKVSEPYNRAEDEATALPVVSGLCVAETCFKAPLSGKLEGPNRLSLERYLGRD